MMTRKHLRSATVAESCHKEANPIWVASTLYPGARIVHHLTDVNQKLLIPVCRGGISKVEMARGFCEGLTSFWLPLNTKRCSFAVRTKRPGWWIPRSNLSARQALFLCNRFLQGSSPYETIWGRNIHSCFRNPPSGMVVGSIQRSVYGLFSQDGKKFAGVAGAWARELWLGFKNQLGTCSKLLHPCGHAITKMGDRNCGPPIIPFGAPNGAGLL